MVRVPANWLAASGLTLAMVLWASSFVALKIAFRSYDPMVVIFGRMVVAACCFLFLVRSFRGNIYRRGDLKYLLLMALCEPCLYFIFEAKAVEHTTASQAGMITAMLPLLVAMAARAFLKELVSRKTIIGFVISILGVCWLSATGEASQQAPNPPLGNFLEFIAMVCATGYMITLKQLTQRYRPLLLTALQAFVGSVFFMPFMFFRSSALPLQIEPVPLLSILYLGVFVTCGAYGLYNYGVSRMPANQATAYVNLIPVFTVVLGWLILHEQFTPPQYAASALVLVGVFISQQKPTEVQRGAAVQYGKCYAAHRMNR